MKINIKMFILFYKEQVKKKGWDGIKWHMKIRNLCVVFNNDLNKLLKILLGKWIYVKQVELVLTTKCTLRCKECANLMQYYTKPYDIDKILILESLNKMLGCIDEIDTVVLVGGEPFIYKDISEIIEKVALNEKVNTIHIFTNGTILPKESCIKALQNRKVKIIISDYGKISRNKEKLVKYCVDNQINFYLKNEDLFWGLVGDMKKRGRTTKQLKTQFMKCNNMCRSILNGKLYYCPRAGHGDDLGYVKAYNYEYVDLRKEKISTEELLKVIYSDYYFSACDYCNYGTKEMISIIPGEQMESGEKKNLF